MQEFFLAIQKGIYRRQILGLYKTLDTAQFEGMLAIHAEDDHYHDVEIVRLLVGQRDPGNIAGNIVCLLGWDKDTKRVVVRRGEPLHTEGG